MNKNYIIDNPKSYNILIILSMIYTSIALCNAILTNRYVGVNNLYVLGGTLTSPLVFILDDIIAEIYGYKVARQVIITGFFAEIVFSIICILVIKAPYPNMFKDYDTYNSILGYPLLYIIITGFASYIIANLINSYILTQWKILVKGRFFWLRSLGSSGFSAGLYSLFAILVMQINKIPLSAIFKLIAISYAIKIMYFIFFAFLGDLLVNFIKKYTNLDVYDNSTKFTSYWRNT